MQPLTLKKSILASFSVNAGEWVGSRWSSVLFHCLTIIGGIAMCSISGLLRSCALWSAFLLLSLAAFAQQPCGVSVSLIPAGKDTIQVQGGLVERCIYQVELLNSRNDVFSVRFDVISSRTTIWMASTGGHTPMLWAIAQEHGGSSPQHPAILHNPLRTTSETFTSPDHRHTSSASHIVIRTSRPFAGPMQSVNAPQVKSSHKVAASSRTSTFRQVSILQLGPSFP